jgi:hypothetical protein
MERDFWGYLGTSEPVLDEIWTKEFFHPSVVREERQTSRAVPSVCGTRGSSTKARLFDRVLPLIAECEQGAAVYGIVHNS